jgi:hypothetical protein
VALLDLTPTRYHLAVRDRKTLRTHYQVLHTAERSVTLAKILSVSQENVFTLHSRL